MEAKHPGRFLHDLVLPGSPGYDNNETAEDTSARQIAFLQESSYAIRYYVYIRLVYKAFHNLFWNARSKILMDFWDDTADPMRVDNGTGAATAADGELLKALEMHCLQI